MQLQKLESYLNGEKRIAVLGLGYVGLPLAVALARRFRVTGFDIGRQRVEALQAGNDATGEVDSEDLCASSLELTWDPAKLENAELIIAAVPTPIDAHRNPDLTPLVKASETIGRHLRQGAVVVYESTVYPGVTEEVCVPVLERFSGKVFGKDFSVGYSPERINPGDRVHTLAKVKKIVSGSDAQTLDLLSGIYGSVIEAGIHRAPSIRVAEAAKVIENTQRDLNIALMNELSVIFDRMDIDTIDVLEAAGTKWNFLPFRPGLVGGHCIGVDPYYLTYKAESLGCHPQVILAGRRINDGMGKYVAEMCVKRLIRRGCRVRDARVGIMGFTFKENVPDLRNTKVADVVKELEEYGISVIVSDPMADPLEAEREYGIALHPMEDLKELDALILAVSHRAFLPFDPKSNKERFADPEKALILDVKGCLPRQQFLDAGYSYWRL
ncbi:MAG: nucleotide sugar dehydrogenase [Desulfovibrionaceae bacterium]|nr:nucleotide sugar dehydrogenase [Desulfovibrionaceae bacterium]